MFLQVSVCPQGGGRAWLLRGGGGMLVAPGGSAWLLRGGMRGCSWGDGSGCSGGHAWLLWGGVRGCSWGDVCGCSGGAWLLPGGACVVAPGGVCGCSWGGMCGCSRGGMHAWLLPGGHAWFLRGACIVAPGGRAWFHRGGVHGFFDEIRSMSGRYASYWNLFLLKILKTFVASLAVRQCLVWPTSSVVAHLLKKREWKEKKIIIIYKNRSVPFHIDQF